MKRIDELRTGVLVKFKLWLSKFEVLPAATEFKHVAELDTFDRWSTFLPEHVILDDLEQRPVQLDRRPGEVFVTDERPPSLVVEELYERFAAVHGYRPDVQASIGTLQERLIKHIASLGITRPIMPVSLNGRVHGYRGVVLREIRDDEFAVPPPALHREHLSESTKEKLRLQVDAANEQRNKRPPRRRMF